MHNSHDTTLQYSLNACLRQQPKNRSLGDDFLLREPAHCGVQRLHPSFHTAAAAAFSRANYLHVKLNDPPALAILTVAVSLPWCQATSCAPSV